MAYRVDIVVDPDIELFLSSDLDLECDIQILWTSGRKMGITDTSGGWSSDLHHEWIPIHKHFPKSLRTQGALRKKPVSEIGLWASALMPRVSLQTISRFFQGRMFLTCISPHSLGLTEKSQAHHRVDFRTSTPKRIRSDAAMMGHGATSRPIPKT